LVKRKENSKWAVILFVFDSCSYSHSLSLNLLISISISLSLFLTLVASFFLRCFFRPSAQKNTAKSSFFSVFHEKKRVLGRFFAIIRREKRGACLELRNGQLGDLEELGRRELVAHGGVPKIFKKFKKIQKIQKKKNDEK
jgi:hypothetical protein